MPTPENQVRVFISSTFRDMHAERDHLVTVVFPELRERVEQLGLEFFDVDLRWGVPAKDLNGETANSWEYCRQWIDRVEPFFVCILGQRYGWVPEPHHFRDTADRQRQQREPRSITDLEVRHAVLDTRRKRRSYFYLRATPVPEPNGEYVDPPEYQGRLEALKTAVRHCGRPQRHYSPAWTGQGFVRLKEFGDYVLDDLWSGVLRDERYVPKAVWRQVLNAAPDTDPRYTDESQPVPRELWEKIVALAKPPPQDPLDAERQQMEAFAATRLRWFQGRTHELKQLTEFIRSTDENAPRLAVVAAAPGQGKSALLAKLWQELSAVSGQPSAFVFSHFVGATERSATTHALVQRLLDELDHSGIEWPADEVKEGEGPKRDFNGLCNRLRQRLGDYSGDRRIVILLDALNQLTDGHDLVWLPSRLGPSVRVVVSCVVSPSPAGAGEGGRRPGEGQDEPRSSRGNEAQTSAPRKDQSLLTSAATPEQQVLGALERRKDTSLRVPLGLLTEVDVRTIVVEYLKEYCHELDREHLDTLCAIPQAYNPLYLLVMLNELRTLGGNNLNVIVPSRIASMSRDYPDTVALFRWVLQRLEVFGAEAVRWWCLYLAHGRVGMASHELADLLARKLGANASATALLIDRGLRRYLLRRGRQLDFFHGQLRQAVMEQYGPQAETTTVHQEMADYFRELADPDRNESWKCESPRPFLELPFHMVRSDVNELARILFDYNWLQAKTNKAMILELIEDYDNVLHALSPLHDSYSSLTALRNVIRLSSHTLANDSSQLAPHLHGRLLDQEEEQITTFLARVSSLARRPWLRPSTRSLTPPIGPLIYTLVGHSSIVQQVAMTPSGKRAISVSEDKTVKIWDIEKGCLVNDLPLLEGRGLLVNSALACNDHYALLATESPDVEVVDLQNEHFIGTLHFHNDSVLSIDLAANGLGVFWTAQHKVEVWDITTGDKLHSFENHNVPVTSVAISREGHRVVSASDDGAINVWDLTSGCLVKSIKDNCGNLRAVATCADSCSALFTTINSQVRIWNIERGQFTTIRRGEVRGYVFAVGISQDGSRAISTCFGSMEIWDVVRGALLTTVNAHADIIKCVALSAGGHRVVSASNDGTLKVWELSERLCLAPNDYSRGNILALAVEQSNQQCVSVEHGRGPIFRFWDLRSGSLLRTLECEGGWPVTSVVIATGILRAMSASDGSELYVWNLNNGQLTHTLRGGGTLEAMAISSDGRRAVAAYGYGEFGSRGRKLKMWNLDDGALLEEVDDLPAILEALALSKNGNRAVFISTDNVLRIWDSGSQQIQQTSHRVKGWVGAIVLTPKGDRAIVAGDDGIAEVWDLGQLRLLRLLRGHRGPVTNLGLAPELHRGVSCSADCSLKLWDTMAGKCIATFTGESSMTTCAIDPSGKFVIAGEASGCVHFLHLVLPEDTAEKI